MDESVDSVFDFDKGSEIRQITYLALEAGAGRVLVL